MAARSTCAWLPIALVAMGCGARDGNWNDPVRAGALANDAGAPDALVIPGSTGSGMAKSDGASAPGRDASAA